MYETELNLLQEIEKKKSEIVEFLRKLIRFPSITGQEKDIQEFIASKLDSMGLKIDMFEPDVNELKKSP